jgi:AbrB family looped-hinge helix DNA binding protein
VDASEFTSKVLRQTRKPVILVILVRIITQVEQVKESIMDAPKGKMAAVVRVGEKGQIVIPKAARDMFNIKPGDTLLLLADEKRGIAIVRQDKFAEFTDRLFRTMELPVDPED